MRWLLVIGGVALALFVAGRHFHWRRADPATHLHRGHVTYFHGKPGGAATGGNCGLVADVHYATRSNGRPTFIDLGHPYPNETLTVVIWGSDRARFDPPPESLQGRRICVSGAVRSYHGRPEIIAYGPGQIRLE